MYYCTNFISVDHKSFLAREDLFYSHCSLFSARLPLLPLLLRANVSTSMNSGVMNGLDYVQVWGLHFLTAV